MNFYKHHLGDYAAATSHLTWDEDCAYRRLLDAYYKREQAIPADVKEACRLCRAQTSGQRRAIETVLREFFVLADDGWHQKRCDLELAAANAQADTNRRIAADREAKKRERTEHEALNEPSTNRSPATSGEREPSQTPDSRLQTKPKAAPRATRLAADWSLPDDWRAYCVEKRPDLNADTVAEDFRGHWLAKPGKDGLSLDWSLVWQGWVRRQFAAKPPVNGHALQQFDDWWKSDVGTDRKGKEVGVMPRGGESYPSYRERIWQKIKEPQHA